MSPQSNLLHRERRRRSAAGCCLIVLPGKKWVSHVVAGVAVPAAFAALYTAIIA